MAWFGIIVGTLILVFNRKFSELGRDAQKKMFGLHFSEQEYRIPTVIVAIVFVIVGCVELLCVR